MAITAFLSRSPRLLNRGPGGPASLGHVPHSSIFSPTNSNFLSPGLYNNFDAHLLPASVTISHSIQPLDSQGYILIFLDRMHLLFTLVHFLFWQPGRVQLTWTSCRPGYIIIWRPLFFLRASQFRTQFNPSTVKVISWYSSNGCTSSGFYDCGDGVSRWWKKVCRVFLLNVILGHLKRGHEL